MRVRTSASYLFSVFLLALVLIGCAHRAPAQSSTPQASRPWMNTQLSAEERAELVLQQMTLDEKLELVHGNGMAHVPNWQMPRTNEGNGGAGYVVGVPRLGIPALYISDAAYGVRDSGANGRYSTALPSNLGAASSWDTDSACAYGQIIGSELRAQGYNMTLGGGVNLAREPRNGRTFEYAGEDPLLAGTLVGHRVKCEQAEHVVGDLKHYALNDQETGRFIVDSVIGRRAMQESDLLAFHIAYQISNAAAVMCSYNRINGDYGCENPYTLGQVLKKQWGFKGFVLSDWGGTHSTEKASAAGLDQEQPMGEFFGPKLKAAVEAGRVPMAELDDHARRVLFAEFISGIVDFPVQKSVVDAEHGLEVAQAIEEKSIVLLKNAQQILPIDAARVHTIAIIGAHADVGMISGGGSAQVDPPVGNAILPAGKGATTWQQHIWFPTSPLKALRAKLPKTKIEYNSGDDPKAAAEFAKQADLVLVFAEQWQSEAMDLPSLSLPGNQDALIAAVAEANPHTVVVLETGSAVTMPWLGKVAGVVETWFAGSGGHKALANVLAGDVNPSGKLALSFPQSESDLPRATIPAAPKDEHFATGPVNPGVKGEGFSVHYDEGAAIGYKWYEGQQKKPLFAFGYGLSYTTFAYSGLTVDAASKTVRFTVTNTGKRAGAEVAQVYARLPKGAAESYKRLAGWKRLELAPGQSQTVTVALDTRVLQSFNEATEAWTLASGSYQVLVGSASDNTPLTASIAIN